MGKHGIDIMKQIKMHLNLGQVPIMAIDQPLFAPAKFDQCCWPLTHGEHQFVVIFGGLHIEMGLWNPIGMLSWVGMDNSAV